MFPVAGITVAEPQTKTWLVIDQALREPVRVTRDKRPVAVMVSSNEFARLEAIEDAFWGEAAKMAALSGSVEKEEIQKLLKRPDDADA